MGGELKQGTIVYIGGFELPDKNAAAHRVLNNGKVLRELGYEVVFIGVRHDIRGIITEEHYGFTCWSIPYPVNLIQWLRYLSSTKILKNVVQQLKNVRGIIFYNYQAVALAKGIHFCKKNHMWSIADVTEWYVAPKSNPIFWVIKQFDTMIRMRFLNNRADGVIAISRYLKNYYNNKKRIVVQIPPLVDKSEEKWVGDIGTDSDERIKLVYAGSTSDFKDNLGVVLQALYPYRDQVSMQIVGMDKEMLKKMLTDDMYEHYVGKHVKIYGRMSHLECVEIIKKSDFQIFVRPKNLVTEAGFPTKLGESFACGTPVITNCSSNIDDYLQNGINGFLIEEISKEQIGCVVEKIIKLMDADILKMKHSCKKSNVFDYRLFIEETHKFLMRIEVKKLARSINEEKSKRNEN